MTLCTLKDRDTHSRSRRTACRSAVCKIEPNAQAPRLVAVRTARAFGDSARILMPRLSGPVLLLLLLPLSLCASNPSNNVSIVSLSPIGLDSGFCAVSAPCATLRYAVEAVAAYMYPLDALVPVAVAAGAYAAGVNGNQCGIHSPRPLNITGSGAFDSIFDCAGMDRLITVTGSLLWSQASVVNASAVGDGGALSVLLDESPGNTICISYAMFSHCSASGSGGAVAVRGSASHTQLVAVFSQSIFLSNTIENSFINSGGSVRIRVVGSISDSIISVQDCVFSEPSAVVSDQGYAGFAFTQSGGVAASVQVLVANSSFTGCGGALGGCAYISLGENRPVDDDLDSSLDSVGVTVVNCSFEGAYSYSGPAVSLSLAAASITNSSATLMSSSFRNCESLAQIESDGVVAVSAVSRTWSVITVYASGVIFDSNGLRTTGSGLSVSTTGPCNLSITVQNSVFSNNNGTGGLVLDSECTTTACMVVATITNITFIGNTGGGAHLGVSGVNTPTIFEVINCHFVDNVEVEGAGGALYVMLGSSLSSNAVLTISNSTFVNNSAVSDQGSGGAVYVLVTSLNRLANHNVHVQDCLFSGNTAASNECISASFPRCWSSFMSLWAGGGALSIARNAAASVNDSLLSITGCLFERNTALEGNGGAIDIDYSAILNSVILMANVQIVLDNCTLFGNTALDGDGGGISFASPQEFSRNVLYCTNNSAVTPFREWTVNSSIAIQHSVVSSNAVSCNTCSGGGLSINPGSSIRLVDSVVINNSAEFFGGGIYLGGTSPGIASCSFSSSDSMILGNAAQRGGGQLYNNCGGSVEWMNTTVDLGTSTLEVVMPLTGNVSSFSTLFQCPVASKFEDAFFGLYGNGSYLTTYSSPWDTPPNYLNTPCYYYGSTLQFGCVNCPVGTYSMSRGHSDGSPGSADNLTCLACPFGGHCENGTLCATPGYWGSGSPTVSFTLCPSGYCCAEFPCSAIDACTGHREGMLCGDCEQGYQPAVGSVACVRESQCKHDSAIFWPLFVLGCFLGSLLLLLASSVAFGPKGNNSVRIKVIVYFYQMIGYMDTTDVSTTVYRVGRTMASLFQFRLPSSVSHAGLCVITGMSPLGKVYFDASVPFAVAIALIIVLGLIAVWKRGRDTTSAVSDESWSERTPLFQRELSGYGDVSTSFMSSQPARVVTGQARVFAILTSAGIMLYSAVNSAVLQMLHCVPLPGVDAGTTRLFLQASVACDYTGWQLPFIILLVCLVCVPILLGLCAQRAMSDVESPWWSGARLALTLPYTDRWCAWESVLMSHRLLLAIVFAFGPGYPVLQTTAASLICLLFLLGHVGCGAVSHTPSQVLQTCLLTLLCIAALARTFHAARTQLAIFADDSVTTSVLEAVTALSTLVLPLVCFLLSYARPCRRQLPT